MKSSVIVTFAYCDTFLWSQQCHNKREALYPIITVPSLLFPGTVCEQEEQGGSNDGQDAEDGQGAQDRIQEMMMVAVQVWYLRNTSAW